MCNSIKTFLIKIWYFFPSSIFRDNIKNISIFWDNNKFFFVYKNKKIKKNKKAVKELSEEIDDLRNDLFYFIKNLDESTIKGASNFYINVLGSLQDISESLQYISKVTFKHINNNHKALTFNQIRELKEISLQLETLFERTKFAFSKNNFKEISSILDSKQELLDSVREKINNQIARTKSEESSPKNTTLYFSILTESKDLIKATMAMLELYLSLIHI